MDNVYDHVKYLSYFLLKKDYNNVNLYNNIIIFFPEEINIIILKHFIESTLKYGSGSILDKREIKMFSDPNFRRFNRCLKNSTDRLMISNHLEIVRKALINSYFHETYYDLIEIFNHQMGFTPTKEYFLKLLKIFPKHQRPIAVQHQNLQRLI